MPASRLLPGDPASIGRYELLGRVASGGMGVVYLGREDGRPDSLVAIKTARTGTAMPEHVVSRLRHEARTTEALSALTSEIPGLARFVGADADTDEPWIATEYVPGPSLHEAAQGGGLPHADVLAAAATLARTLAAVHLAEYAHRDVKPANVVLGPDGVRLVDLGLARRVGEPADGLALGSPGWSPPEQRSAGEDSRPGDVHGWAMTVAFAARGSSPFGTGHPHLVARRMLAGHPHLSGVPHPLLHVVRSALDPDPARRPTAADLVEALDLQEQRYAGRDAVLGLAVAEAHGTTPATMTAGFAPPTLIELTSPAPTAAHTTAGPHPGRPRPKLRRVALIGCAALALGLVLVGGRDLSAPSTADGAPAPQVSRSPSASPAPVARPATPTAQRTTPRAAAAPAGQHGPKAHKHKHGHPG